MNKTLISLTIGLILIDAHHVTKLFQILRNVIFRTYAKQQYIVILEITVDLNLESKNVMRTMELIVSTKLFVKNVRISCMDANYVRIIMFVTNVILLEI